VYVEAFVVCEDYRPPDGYLPTMANPFLDHKYGKWRRVSALEAALSLANPSFSLLL